jgi:phosphopantetheinyl transferase
VGVDVEVLRPVSPELVRKAAREEEFALLAGASTTDPAALEPFFRIWTAKEAVLKAETVGIAGLSECRVEAAPGAGLLAVRFRDRLWTVEQVRFDGHLAAVAFTGAAEVDWTVEGGQSRMIFFRSGIVSGRSRCM